MGVFEGRPSSYIDWQPKTATGTTIGVVEDGNIELIGTLDWTQRLLEGASALATAIDQLADESGARAAALDGQDRKMADELTAAFDAYAADRRVG